MNIEIYGIALISLLLSIIIADKMNPETINELVWYTLCTWVLASFIAMFPASIITELLNQ